MLSFTRPALNGWHDGEKKLQRQLQYSDEVGDEFINISSELPAQHRAFHSTRLSFLPLATRSADDGRVWCSILCPSPEQPPHTPGAFISSPSPTSLIVLADVWAGDPIRATLQDGGLVAGVGVELETRRRNKFAGSIAMSAWNADQTKLGMEIAVNEAIGNCPKYITTQHLIPYHANAVVTHSSLQLAPTGPGLPPSLIAFIHAASALYLATSSGTSTAKNPSHMGCNHRGGPPGFARILPSSDGRTLVIPDFSGNRFMSSLGNVELSPFVGITFPDFTSGSILYLSGEAENVTGPAASRIMERCKVITIVKITGFVYVENAITVRRDPTAPKEESPYSPRVRFLVEERQAAGFVDATAGGAGIEAKLVKVERVAEDIARFDFELDGEMKWKAGQYVVLDCLELLGGEVGYQHMTRKGKEKTVNEDGVRTWTISSTPSSSRLSITLRLLPSGIITPRLFYYVNATTSVPSLTLPLLGIGGAFLLPAQPSKTLWVAGGIGITPFLSFLGTIASEAGWNIELVVATREPQAIVDLVEKALGGGESLAAKVHLLLFTTSEAKLPVAQHGHLEVSMDRKRLGQEDLQRVVSDFEPESVYLCGPEAFEKAAMEGLAAAGVKGEDVIREKFNF